MYILAAEAGAVDVILAVVVFGAVFYLFTQTTLQG